MLTLEPGRPDPAHGPAAGQHVEGGDHLAEQGHVAVGDPRDERPEPGPVRDRRQVAERGVGLQHRVPLPPHLRDLDEVVHHPQGREARLLGRRRHLGEPRPDVGGAAFPREARQLETELQAHRVGILAAGVGIRVQELLRNDLDRTRRQHGVEPLAGKLPAHPPPGAQLPVEHLDGHRPRPVAVALPAHLGGSVEADGVTRQAVGASEFQVAEPALVVEAERVDDGEQAPGDPARHDQVEHVESVPTRSLVVLGFADGGPQPV